MAEKVRFRTDRSADGPDAAVLSEGPDPEFVGSRPLPPESELEALRQAHLEFLDMLDEEFGPPSEEDVKAAEEFWSRLLAER